MTVESLEIENFQRHEKFRVDFDPQLTTIIGQTDAGKSSLLRALRWVALNLPDGDSFIRHGSNGAVATLRIDGHEITRKRLTNGENTYHLDGNEYKAFGRGVPDTIAALLQVDRINFVGQKEPDFWFSLPPVEVARQLNAIVDLGVIDDALENIGRKVRQGQDAVKTATERMATSKAQRDSLEWVESAERSLTDVETAWATVETTEQQIATLRSYVSHIEHYEQQRDAAAARVDAIADVGRAGAACLKISAQIDGLAALIVDIERYQTAASYSGDITPIVDAVGCYQAATDQIGRLTALIVDIERLERNASRPLGDFAAVEVAYNYLQDLNAQIRRLSMAITDIEDNAAAARIQMNRVESLQTEIEKLTAGRCPICGSEMPSHERCGAV